MNIVEQLLKFQKETNKPFSEAIMEVFESPEKHLTGGYFVPDSNSHGSWEPATLLKNGDKLSCADLIKKTNLSICEFNQMNKFVRVAKY